MIEEDDRSKTIYIIMPYYKVGNFKNKKVRVMILKEKQVERELPRRY